MRTACRALAAACGLLVGCGGGNDTPLPPADVPDPDIRFTENREEADGGRRDLCEILWNKQTLQSGGTSHPALGKGDIIYVTAFSAVYALGKTGNEEWVWPDDDTVGAVKLPEGGEQLYSPAIGNEGVLYMGSSQNRVVAVNKNGTGRWAVDVDAPVTGAPAISEAGRVLVLSDLGGVYHIKDLGQKNGFVAWQKTAHDGLEDVLPGQQPIIGLKLGDGSEPLYMLSRPALHCWKVEDGSGIFTFPMPEGLIATSNLVMDADGTAWLAAGKGAFGDYFDETYLVAVLPDGTEKPDSRVLVYGGKTRGVSLSQGRSGTFIVGTNNAGLFVVSVSQKLATAHHFKDYQDVAQPFQGGEGIIYFGALPHWLYAISDAGDDLWHLELDPSLNLGAKMSPGSPLPLPDGSVLFHNGNLLQAVRCSSEAPPVLAWPRFGGGTLNTGNIADSAALAP